LTTEREWVETIKADLGPKLKEKGLIVVTGHKLAYENHILSYNGNGLPLSGDDPNSDTHEYQTDFLVAEFLRGTNTWVPRVVIEFKFGAVTTHDALTYSTKAETHKMVHPYLRYGIVIGDYKGPVPKRLVRHGHHFDFMATISSEKLTSTEEDQLLDLIQSEVEASQTLGGLLSDKSKFTVLHRKLEVE
jgi:hypothetical protein